jgi:hypothetical protein
MGAVVSQYATGVNATSATLCQLGGPGSLPNPNVIMTLTYKVVTGPGITAGALSLQTLDGDGNWRALAASAQPISGALAASTTYSPTTALAIGPVRGVRWSLSGLTGGSITYLDLIATVQ